MHRSTYPPINGTPRAAALRPLTSAREFEEQVRRYDGLVPFLQSKITSD